MRAVRRILLAQTAVAIVAGMVAWMLAGPVAGYSAWLGGAICVLPNTFLALRMLAARATLQARKMLHATYWGEAGKLALTAALFALVFMLVRPLSPGALFIGFIASQGAIWLAILGDRDALN